MTALQEVSLFIPLAPFPLGVFSWITINYLLGHLSPEYQHPANSMTPGLESSGNESPPQTIKTVGSLDMGGASLQVTFEVPHDVSMKNNYCQKTLLRTFSTSEMRPPSAIKFSSVIIFTHR